MYALIRKNPAMVQTIVSGVLIIVGGMLSYMSIFPADAVIFILSFLIGGYRQGKEGVTELIVNKRVNVDILMILAAIGASSIGYWFEGALLIFIFSLSGSLEIYTTNKSTDAISSLMKLTPDTALRLRDDGVTEEVMIEELHIHDVLIVPKGAAIPIDGILLSPYGLVDESSFSGESIPVSKVEGETVTGGTLNLTNAVKIEVSTHYNDTLLAKIVRLVDEAQGTPSKTATAIKSIETIYVGIILAFVPLMILFFQYGLNWGFSESFYRGMVLLTVASPCALMASVSPATLSAISNGAKKGVLYKGGSFLENFSAVKVIAFDKTGTLTEGKPKVTDELFRSTSVQDSVRSAIIELERASDHPLAKAVVNHYKSMDEGMFREVQAINEVEGKGVEGFRGKEHWKIGKKEFVVTDDDDPITVEALKRENEGKTVLYISLNNQLMGCLALQDTPNTDARKTIEYFKQQGVHTLMITGDNESTGQKIGEMLGIDEVKTNCMPDEKAELILALKEKYQTIVMVGDGINDAPALANASIGIAMGAGTDLAIESADVILVNNDLKQLMYSHQLSKRLNRIILQNVAFSIGVIILLIIVNLLQLINLPLGVVGHESSTIIVILNGLRLLKSSKSS